MTMKCNPNDKSDCSNQPGRKMATPPDAFPCKYKENKMDFVRAVLCALLISMLFSFVLSERECDKERSGIPHGLSVQCIWDDFGNYRGTVTYSPVHNEPCPVTPPQKQCRYCRDAGGVARHQQAPDAREFLKNRHKRFALLWIVFYFVYLVGDYIHPTQDPSGEGRPVNAPFFTRILTYLKKGAKIPSLVAGWCCFLMQSYHVGDLKISALFGILGLLCATIVVSVEKCRNKIVKIVWVVENVAMISAMLCYLCSCGCPCDPWLTDILMWCMPLAAILLSWLPQGTNTESQGDNPE